MYKYFKDLKTIKFPVYALPSTDWYRQDGLLFIDDGQILDDTNMPGKSLGVRRLQTSFKEDLYKLRKAYPNFISMLRSRRNKFIDSNGIPFVYVRKIRCDLIHHKIKKIELKGTHSLIWCDKIPFPFNIPRPPYGDCRWAQVLYYKDAPWNIWSFSNEKGKDSFRRI